MAVNIKTKENNFVFIAAVYYFKLSIELISKNPAGHLINLITVYHSGNRAIGIIFIKPEDKKVLR
jgi:hypothetical protein